MQKLHFSTKINAPSSKVWDTMFEKETYTEWTKPFSPTPTSTGRYEGDWSKGSKILFIGSDPDTGEEGGMVSRIADNVKHKFMSIEHVGILKEGKEVTSGPEIEMWVPAFENYTFTETDGVTQVDVDVDSADEFVEFFNTAWPKGLSKLKEMAERE